MRRFCPFPCLARSCDMSIINTSKSQAMTVAQEKQLPLIEHLLAPGSCIMIMTHYKAVAAAPCAAWRGAQQRMPDCWGPPQSMNLEPTSFLP